MPASGGREGRWRPLPELYQQAEKVACHIQESGRSPRWSPQEETPGSSDGTCRRSGGVPRPGGSAINTLVNPVFPTSSAMASDMF